MAIDPVLFKQLLGTFKIELHEQSQVIIVGLLEMEKKQSLDKKPIMITIFRAAHNIKGSARSLGIHPVAEIAHHLESLFSVLQKGDLQVTTVLTDACLNAVDKMKIAMQAFVDNQPHDFDLPSLLASLDISHFSNEVPAIETVVKETKTEQQEQDFTPESPQQMEAIETGQIRIPINKIENLSALMEEIQVNKISMDDHYAELAAIKSKIATFSLTWKQLLSFIKGNGDNLASDTFQKLIHSGSDSVSEINYMSHQLNNEMKVRLNELSILSSTLQEEIRMLRLIPVENLLCHLPRYVRDLSHELNKNVELIIKGNEVKMDKLILESLKDPLIHLLRNSLDHGIENMETRLAQGKPAIGTIMIQIKEESSKIHILVSDDGAGIDTKKIRDVAERKDLLTHAELEAMDDHQILQLIFRPGFSTATIITDVSGRGVGLDVVKTNLNTVNGTINIETKLGQGTLFDLCVPLTLASERGLVVKVKGQVFVVPTSSIQRVLTINKNELVEVEGCQAILLDDHPIPLYSLTTLLGQEQNELSDISRLSVMVITIDSHTVALLVDDIVGEREIVIKPLLPPLSHIACVAGGTLSGSNQVLIVLDPTHLVNALLEDTFKQRIDFQTESKETVEVPHILVVDDSITTRTLEKNILESKNYLVTVAVNGKEAWDLLQKNKYAMLITDVNMPIMDGFTLTQHVKRHDKLRAMPVIIVTSLGSDAEKKRGIESGADAYIVKNEFESGMLLDIVEQLV